MIMKTTPIFFENMSPSDIDDFILHQSNQHDITCIGQFISAPMMIQSTDSLSRHNALVETRNRLDFIIHSIKAYENKNKNLEYSMGDC